MTEPFVETFRTRWADLDANAHMRNTAFLDYAAEVRMRFFDTNGFSRAGFERLQMGPVIFEDHVVYQRELRMGEVFRVDILLAGESRDRRRFRIRNTFHDEGGVVAAVVTSHGGWFHLGDRKLVAPGPDLAAVLDRMPQASDFHVLGSQRVD